jgi:hypothetical protein
MKIIVEMTPEEYDGFINKVSRNEFERSLNDIYSFKRCIADILEEIDEASYKINEEPEFKVIYLESLINQIRLLANIEEIYARSKRISKDNGLLDE